MTIIRNILLILILILGSAVSYGQETEKERIEHFNLKKTVAISGYDPVSYFVNTPTKGNREISSNYHGITYYFITEKSKNIFIANPSKYEPAYGGWCAYAMGLDKSSKVVINPKTYKIIDNRLYLFYNKLGINTKDKWNKEGETKLKTNANKNWNKIISE